MKFKIIAKRKNVKTATLELKLNLKEQGYYGY